MKMLGAAKVLDPARIGAAPKPVWGPSPFLCRDIRSPLQQMEQLPQQQQVAHTPPGCRQPDSGRVSPVFDVDPDDTTMDGADAASEEPGTARS